MKKLNRVVLLLVISGFLVSPEASGQGVLPEVISSLQNYHAGSGDRRIYIHTDRDSYKGGEIVFFQGYILDFYDPNVRFGGDSVLVAIAADGGKVLSSRTLMIRNSLFSGNLRIPPEFAEGTCRLVAYSQKLTGNGVEKVFVKPLDIRQNQEIDLIVRSEKEISSETGLLLYKVVAARKGAAASGINLSYKATSGKRSVKGSVKTDREGKALIPLNLPDHQKEGWMLYIEAKTRQETGYTYIPVRYETSWIKPYFSPEGGNLIAGSQAIIYGAVSDIFGRIVLCEASVINSKGEVIPLEKNAGGIFTGTLIPQEGVTYSVRLSLPGQNIPDISLPPVLREGATLELKSSGSEKLIFTIRKSEHFDAQSTILMAYMEGKLIYSSKVETKEKETKQEISLEKFTPGVAHFALFDAQGAFLSERPVFISEKMPEIEFRMEPVLKPKSKTQVSWNVKGAIDSPLDFSVSVSDRKQNTPDLFSSMHLLAELPHALHPILYPAGQTVFSEELANQVLACGKIFSWKEAMNPTSRITGNAQQILPLKVLWLSMVQPYLLQNFRDAENAFIFSPDNPYRSKLSSIPGKVNDYSQFSNMLDVLKSIRAFSLIGDKIVFPGAHNSITAQEGALIVIDGVQKGGDVSILSSLSPIDISSVEISTKPQDIQKYTGLNSVGVIEIWTTANFSKGRFPVEEYSIQNAPLLFTAGQKSLLWKSLSGNTKSPEPIEISAGHHRGSFLIRMEGLDPKGKVISGSKNLIIR